MTGEELLQSRRKAIARVNKKIRDGYLNRDIRIQKGTLSYIKKERAAINRLIKDASGWDTEHLPALLTEVDSRVLELDRGFQNYLINEQDSAWDGGIKANDRVLAAGDVRIQLPIVSETQLVALQSHSLGLVKGLQGEMTARVKREISLSVLGNINQFETAVRIDNVLGTRRHGGFTWRAERIARTETNKVYSTANRLRREQTQELIPDIEKEWLTGTNPRDSHAEANGQRVKAKDKFIVGGYYCDGPHDPLLPAEEIVNCNCVDLIIIPDRLLKTPDPSVGITRQPQSPEGKSIRLKPKSK